jgi:hypothetical protein
VEGFGVSWGGAAARSKASARHVLPGCTIVAGLASACVCLEQAAAPLLIGVPFGTAHSMDAVD